MDTGVEEDEGLLAQAKDDDNASGYFYRRKARLSLSIDGIWSLATKFLDTAEQSVTDGKRCLQADPFQSFAYAKAVHRNRSDNMQKRPIVMVSRLS